MAISEMTLNLSCKKRFWFTPALFVGVALCRLLRSEALPVWFVDFVVNYGLKVEVTEC